MRHRNILLVPTFPEMTSLFGGNSQNLWLFVKKKYYFYFNRLLKEKPLIFNVWRVCPVTVNIQ